jgi:hypothetical protein
MVDATSTSLMPRLLHVLLILPCHHLASSFSLLHSLSTQSKAGVCNVYGEDTDLLNTKIKVNGMPNMQEPGAYAWSSSCRAIGNAINVSRFIYTVQAY